jgi:spermidine synthase
VDGFDDGKQPAALCSQAFFDAARDALLPGGMMVVNFMAGDSKLKSLLRRIDKSFDGARVVLYAADRVNMIAFAFKRHPDKIAWAELKKRAAILMKKHDLPFDEFIAGLKRLNPHTQAALKLRVSGDD